MKHKNVFKSGAIASEFIGESIAIHQIYFLVRSEQTSLTVKR